MKTKYVAGIFVTLIVIFVICSYRNWYDSGTLVSMRREQMTRDKRLQITTANVAMLPFGLSRWVHDLSNSKIHASHIHSALSSLNTHVLGLQEVFDSEGSNILVSLLHQQFPHIVHHKSSGLLLATKCSILDISFVPFSAGKFPDNLAQKGFLRVQLSNCVVYNVHLQADQENGVIREKQLAQLLRSIQEQQQQQQPCFVLGDFNIPNPENFNFFFSQFCYQMLPTTMYDSTENLDYILQYDSAKKRRCIEYKACDIFRGVSDHLPVRAEFEK